MSRTEIQLDVLVFGEHPATYVTATLLRLNSDLRVVHATIPGEHSMDRISLLNPRFFELNEVLSPLRRTLGLTHYHGMRFLSDDGETRSAYHSKAAVCHGVSYQELRKQLRALADEHGVQFMAPRQLEIHGIDEEGVRLSLGESIIRAKMLMVGGKLPKHQQKQLGIPADWPPDVLRQYSFIRLPVGQSLDDASTSSNIIMNLNLNRQLWLGWFMAHEDHVQLAVEHPIEATGGESSSALMAHWGNVLGGHGVLKRDVKLHLDTMRSMPQPFAGALAHEGVANRTLLIGPAGGFFSAYGEDLYPNCWSAVYAADVGRKALKEKHLQDALHPYRHRWRTTVGHYLRGPQQDLRFLLPLVYRNPVMTDRLAESILTGKSVVR